MISLQPNSKLSYFSRTMFQNDNLELNIDSMIVPRTGMIVIFL